MTTEYNRNWLIVLKEIRYSQASVSINSCTESSKTQFSLWVLLSEVEIAIVKYRSHTSINAITKKMENLCKHTFSFNFTSYEETVIEVNNLKNSKAFQKTDLLVKFIKENIDTVSYFLYHNFDNSLSSSIFPIGMKHAEVTPIHKHNDKTEKEIIAQ